MKGTCVVAFTLILLAAPNLASYSKCYRNAAKIPKWMPRPIRGFRVTKGEQAEFPLPWQVGLITEEYGIGLFCGGTILNENTILTAAHCTEAFSGELVIVAGVRNWLSDEDGQESSVVEVIYNIEEPHRYPVKFNNDIALVKVFPPLKFGPKIKPACLPMPDFKPENTNELAITSGWGQTTNESGSGSDVLQYTWVPLLTNEECKRTEIEAHAYTTITDSMICAGDVKHGGKDSCTGDSGGPLVVPDEHGNAVIYGIVSFGFACGMPKNPGVYTSVSHFVNWIEKHLY